MDLQNDFTTGDDRYPKNRQSTLHLLDKYTKSAVVTQAGTSEGSAFAQKNAQKGRQDSSNPYDKVYWKDKECYNCHKTGHPSTHCPAEKKDDGRSRRNDDGRSKKSDDDKSRSSKSSKSGSINKLQKKLKKSFATLETRIEELEKEDSDISDSDSEADEASHFQIDQRVSTGIQMLQLEKDIDQRPDLIPAVPCKATVLTQAFEKRNAAVLFKQNHELTKELDLRQVILLDNQSTMDLFCNPELVNVVYKASKPMRLKSNGGTMNVRHKAKMDGYERDVWFSKDAITNIIALDNLTKQYRVTYDSNDEFFVVHREAQGKTNMVFTKHKSGLHCFDPRGKDFTFINTVSGNKEGFTQRQLKGAESAKTLYAKLGYPSMKDFKWVIQSNQIADCPVTVEDVNVAHKIWGKDIAALKGKTTRKKPISVATDFVKVPKEILKLHQEVLLTTDIFFVNQIPFFLTLSRVICFNHLANRKAVTIFKAFEEMYRFYLNRGFRITQVNADGEFAPLQALIQAMPGGPRVNLASSSEHVPEIERRIRVIKERSRSIRHSLPFNKIPTLLLIHIIFYAVKLLNHFPVKGGVSDTLSPNTIMTGETLNFMKHLSLQIGQYCQVHEEDTPRNSQLPRTKGAICLGPSGNVQGGYKFMSLSSMKKIVRRSWDAIQMPDTVIARVNVLGKDQPEQFVFTDRNGRPIGDIERPGVDADADQPDEHQTADIELPGVDGNEVELHPYANDVENDDLDIAPNNETEEDPAPHLEPQVANETRIEVEETFPDEEIVTEETRHAPNAATPAVAPTAGPEEIPGVRRSTRVRLPKRNYVPSMTGKSKYAYAATQLKSHEPHVFKPVVLHPDAHMFFNQRTYPEEPDVVQAIMTQLSLKAGLQEWGDKATEAVRSEMK